MSPAIERAVTWMKSVHSPFSVRDVANAAQLNQTTTNHVCRALEAAGVLRVRTESPRAWWPIRTEAPQ